MSQLIQMQQRIKAVETIKKITQAMRIISMSTHTRLKKKVSHLLHYKNDITHLFAHLKQQFPTWDNPIFQSKKEGIDRSLLIIVSSQKGLAGSFNYNLFAYFSRNMPDTACDIIAIGKKGVDFALHTKGKLIKRYNTFSSQNIDHITREIFTYIMKEMSQYRSVIIYANTSIRFFTQKPYHYQLIPFDNHLKDKKEISLADYTWEQPIGNILDDLMHTYIKTTFYEILLQSLVAEQAARFLSMDGATQNAETMLNEMILGYNKLRQAKITGELTDLSGSFQSD